MTVNLQFILSARPSKRRMLVTGVSGNSPARADLNHGRPHSDEKLRLVSLAQLVVGIPKCLSGTFAVLQVSLNQYPRSHHEQCSGNTLSGYICHYQSYVIIIDQEEIVEVASYLLSRIHAGVDVKFSAHRESRESMRQYGCLDVCRQLQLILNPLTLCLFAMLFFKCPHLSAYIQPHQQKDNNKRRERYKEIEPPLLIKSLFLDDLYGYLLVASAHGVLKLHRIVICSAPQVGVIYRHHITAVDRRALILKAIQPAAYLRIAQRIIEYKAVNSQLLRIGWNRKCSVRIGIKSLTIHIHKRNRSLQVIDILKWLFDVDLADACGSGNIQITFRGHVAVGVCGSDTGQTVGDTVVHRVDLPVGNQFLGRCHIDAVAGKHPYVTLAVLK